MAGDDFKVEEDVAMSLIVDEGAVSILQTFSQEMGSLRSVISDLSEAMRSLSSAGLEMRAGAGSSPVLTGGVSAGEGARAELAFSASRQLVGRIPERRRAESAVEEESRQKGGWSISDVLSAAEKWGLADFARGGKLGDIDFVQMLGQVGSMLGGTKIGSAMTAVSGAAAAAGPYVMAAQLAAQMMQRGFDEYRKFYEAGTVTGAYGGKAFLQGAEIDLQSRVMAISPFVDTEQARQIINSVYRQGYVGKDAETVMEFAAKNFQKFNMDVADSVKMYQTAIEGGTMSIGELNAALEGMHDIALQTNLSVSDVTDAFQKFNESVGAQVGMPEKRTPELVAAVGALKQVGLGAEVAESFIMAQLGSLKSPLYNWARQMGYTETQISEISRSPERAVGLMEEMIVSLVEQVMPQLRPLAEQSPDSATFIETCRDAGVYAVFDTQAVRDYLAGFGFQASTEDLLVFYWSAVNKKASAGSRRYREEQSRVRIPTANERASGTVKAMLAGSPTAMTIGGIIGAVQRMIPLSKMAWGWLTGDTALQEQAKEEYGAKEYLDLTLRTAAQEGLGMLMGKKYTREGLAEWREQMTHEQIGSREASKSLLANMLGISPFSMGPLTVNISLVGDAKKIVNAWVEGESKDKMVGKGMLGRNE